MQQAVNTRVAAAATMPLSEVAQNVLIKVIKGMCVGGGLWQGQGCLAVRGYTVRGFTGGYPDGSRQGPAERGFREQDEVP